MTEHRFSEEERAQFGMIEPPGRAEPDEEGSPVPSAGLARVARILIGLGFLGMTAFTLIARAMMR